MKPPKSTILKRRPKTFRKLTGLTIEKFEELLHRFQPLYHESEERRLYKPNRQRARGGGRNQELSLEDKLVMLLMYYRLYLTHEFLGFLFNLHNSNVSRHFNQLQPVLAQVFCIPTQRIPLSEVEVTEEQLVELFIDATEQQIQRPHRKQKIYYSGKKKKHTLKNQLVVNARGKILEVSKSHPGATHDKKLYTITHVYTNKKSRPIADLGYLGVSTFQLPFKKPKRKQLTADQKQFNKKLSQKRIIIEHSIGKMKIFQILVQTFRNPLHTHSLIFKNVAGIYNLMFT